MYFLLAPTYWANTAINQAGAPITPLLAGYTEPPCHNHQSELREGDADATMVDDIGI